MSARATRTALPPRIITTRHERTERQLHQADLECARGIHPKAGRRLTATREFCGRCDREVRL